MEVMEGWGRKGERERRRRERGKQEGEGRSAGLAQHCSPPHYKYVAHPVTPRGEQGESSAPERL
ncbi:hypothetical protein PPACK8108_LOCUS8717 [Phakopsora pachyrhizi]|uniref:Uncharacterized protein n=1 Tax=Phakopsora pachyrhizi TaxID=170000 RepID=A0AAV0AV41_PHAPC|nr:hypothetical protein PPACK8108_LOCUS8717 [Phakopsora pachyrhizi]